MSTEKPVSATLVKTGECRLSYAHIWKPTAAKGSDKMKYSVSILIRKDDKATLRAVRAGIEAAKELYVKKLGPLPKNWSDPLHDGDEEKPNDEAYKNCFYLSAKSDQKPGIVHIENGAVVKLEDESELVSGDYAKVQVNFYPSDKMTKGIFVGLNNILKTRSGEALAGRSSAVAAFADEADEDLM